MDCDIREVMEGVELNLGLDGSVGFGKVGQG